MPGSSGSAFTNFCFDKTNCASSRRRTIMSVSRLWTGVLLIGDGVSGLIWPRRYLRLLKVGPAPVRKTLEAFAERPSLTRALCIAEVGLGIWTISRDL